MGGKANRRRTAIVQVKQQSEARMNQMGTQRKRSVLVRPYCSAVQLPRARELYCTAAIDLAPCLQVHLLATYPCYVSLACSLLLACKCTDLTV